MPPTVRPIRCGLRSLSVILSGLFVAQIAVAVGIVGFLSYQNSQEAIRDLIVQVQNEVDARVHQHLQQYLNAPQLINQINQQALQSGLLTPADIEKTIRYFRGQGQIFPGYSTLAFADAQGGFVGVNASEQYIVVADPAEPGRPLRRWALMPNGLPGALLVERGGYDARTRAYYQAALAAGRPIWSDIAPAVATNRLDITAASPAWDAAAGFQGVFVVDVSLELISHYLSSVPISQSGQIFIIDRQGYLVATSAAEPLFVVTDAANNTLERVAANRSQQPLVAAAAQTLATAPNQTQFNLPTGHYYLQALPYQDDYGLDWQIVVVLPEADFMDHINANNRQTLALSLATLVVAIGLSLLTARWITRPILRVNQAARQVAQGDTGVTLPPTQRLDEIGVLTRSFQHMVDQLRQAHGALRDSEQQLANIINFLPDPTFVINAAGEIIAWNRAMESLTGRSAAEMLGKGNYEHALPFHNERQPGLVDVALHPEAPLPADFGDVTRTADGGWEGEGYAVTASGEHRYFYSRAARLYDAQGQVSGAVETLHDTTDHKRAEEEIHRLNLSLEQRVWERTEQLDAANQALSAVNIDLSHALRSRDEFLATMSHELRTPLTAILGLSEALLLNIYGALAEKQRKPASLILESGQHLLALINDILDLSKVEAGKINLDVRPAAVRDVCLSSLRFVTGQANKKHLKVTFSQAVEVTSLHTDERRLKQILVNLLGNAVKFTPDGGGVGLQVSGDAQAQAIRFTVWDTGIGIAPELMPKLFKPFVQLDNRLARAYEGTGLGLALVRRLTEVLGGSVALESDGVPGQGCRFTVTLPWAEASLSAGTAAAEAAVAPGGVLARPPARILVADDNEVQLTYLADSLRSLGSTVDTARTGLEALEHTRAGLPDLIVMDIQMPGMDGLEAIQRLRADPALARIPIIALTALVMPGDRERCLTAGASAYLTKPIHLAGLVGVMAQLCPPAP
jgi:PAS domain S-box-containing protein